ncbi:hypothetical protein C0Q70_17766 [Pomacea canaliculata]|uniref:LIM zinc-binding domain-containing protein n=1 Tax=Pomacea canaliculata TaxID=400727 RepID=A0A2T7NLB9_POMCA|nr:hypothetical protein C0Q70_17766 [Pomacea canaliculata]
MLSLLTTFNFTTYIYRSAEDLLTTELWSLLQRGPPLMGGGASGDEQPPGVCAGCGRRIVDRYYLQAVDKQWHVQCLTCSDCHYRLDSELTCFARDGQIYCKEDYYRRFAMKRCSRCHQGISANELVMRARDQVFHLMCFSCTACHRTLTPGEEFGLRDNQVYCRTDYELMFQGDYIPSLSPGIGGPAGLSTHSPNPNGPIPFYNGVGAVQKGRPRKRKSPLPDGDGCTNMDCNQNSCMLNTVLRPTLGLVASVEAVTCAIRVLSSALERVVLNP